jgi:hypothetical protein
MVIVRLGATLRSHGLLRALQAGAHRRSVQFLVSVGLSNSKMVSQSTTRVARDSRETTMAKAQA